MVYFDDAEPELAAIMLANESGAVRAISEKEWTGIKEFFVRFCL
jgi:hypothetical protein